ncbi:MAG: hypothetical protein ABI461_00520 [Polyangiaceae bacterium]
MRSFPRGAAVATAVCAFVAVAGCAGDDTIVSLDGDAGLDAAAPFDGGPIADGGSSDAFVNDTGTIDPAVTVVALGATGPIAGATVVFYSPDGSPQPALVTGVAGTVSAVVAAGSAVTISLFSQQNDGPLYDITTFIGLAPGDHLTAIPSRGLATTSADPGTVTVTTPGAIMDAATYDWANGCNEARNAGGDQVLAVGPECIGGADAGTLGIFGTANAVSGAWLASAEAVGASYVDGGTVSGLAWSSIAPTLLPVSGSPNGAPLSFEFAAAYYSGVHFYADLDVKAVVAGAFTAPQITLPTSALLTDAVTTARLEYPASTTPGAVAVQITQAPVVSGISVDFASMPPNVHDAIVTADGTGNGSLSFTADAALTALDGLTARYKLTIPLTDGGSANGTWVVVSPARTTTTMPTLTKDLLPSFPSTMKLVTASLVHGTQYGSYGVYRRAYPKIAVGGELASAPYRVEAVFFGGN